MKNPSIIVLKFGSSVLRQAGDFAVAAKEIRRCLSDGQRVVAVVSAMGDETNRLMRTGQAVSKSKESSWLAEFVATGEQQSTLLLALALDDIGVLPNTVSPNDIGLVAEGPTLNANLVDVDESTLLSILSLHPVVIVPGFVGVNRNAHVSLLGRGGSDLTALFLAERLGARCRLIKDVDGIYDRDPAIYASRAHKFSKIGWNDALGVAGKLVQPKALRFAGEHQICFEVACPGSSACTIVGPRTIWPSRAGFPSTGGFTCSDLPSDGL